MGNTMKKYYLILFLLVLSCTKDEIEILPPTQEVKMIFSEQENSVIDGEDINFEIMTEGVYHLVITDEDTNSVIGKEKFTSSVGITTRKIYTKSLPTKKLKLSLLNSSREEIYKTNIIIE
jgi:hypothetical protein